MFVKIFADLLDSSLWSQDSDTRIVWVTMLMMAEDNGLVRATLPGLANRARVSDKSTEKALHLFEQPDPNSRTPDNDGRRIERVSGGYMILNYRLYRGLRSARERKEYMRKYIADRRKTEPPPMVCKHPVNTCKQMLAQAEAEAEAEADTTDSQSPAATDPLLAEWIKFKKLWNEQATTLALPKISDGSGIGNQKRYRFFRTRCSDKSWLEDWRKAILKISGSPFLRGDNQRGWRANVDWFLRPGSVEKILEGAYENAKGNGSAQSGDWRVQQEKDLRSAVGEAFDKGKKGKEDGK